MHNLMAIQRAPAWAVALLMLSTPVASSEHDSFNYEQAWALAGPCCGDSGHDIAVEPDGSFFIVGNYGALDLDGDGRADLKSEGGHDAIIMKGRPRWKARLGARTAQPGHVVRAADGDLGSARRRVPGRRVPGQHAIPVGRTQSSRAARRTASSFDTGRRGRTLGEGDRW